MSIITAFSIPGLDWLGQVFAYALNFLYEITGNFGLAIILLTIGMRVVLLPLTVKQTKSMIAMQRLQPQLKEIQKKYKDDREKQGQEMMKLYKENKVSPLGGCLPLLLQLPIIFAVFDVLHNLAAKDSKYIDIFAKGTNYMFLGMDMRLTGSKLWSGNEYIGVIILILLTVVTGYVSAKMMTTDPKQSKMMAIMPVVMGVFAWILPAGVTVYIIVTNALTMIQQWIQLERQGFYEERRAEREKSGEPLKWHENMKFRFNDFGSRVLLAVRIKPVREEIPEKKKTGKPAETVKKTGKKASSKPSSGKAKGIQKKPAQKKPAQKKSTGKKPSGEKPAGKKPAKKKTSQAKGKDAEVKSKTKTYPAKKKSQGKK
jgi:YidC/Oxa1 family membrane protein insertase